MKWLMILVFGLGLCAIAFAQDEGRDTDKQATEEKPTDVTKENVTDEEMDMLKRAFKRHQEELGEEHKLGQESETLNPLEQVVGKMGVVERRLSRNDVGKHTQEKELEVIKILNDLIKQIEEQPQQDSNSQQKQQQQQQKDQKQQGEKNQMQKKMQDPNRSQNAKPGSQRQKKVLEKVIPPEEKLKMNPKETKETDKWGMLKETDREAAEAASSEKFHPTYKKIIEEYYKMLGKKGEK